jgi:DNA polymerase III delta prime subunit
MFDSLWVEKYRPSSLSDMVITPEIASSFEEFKKQQEIPNILFLGNAGIGKTSLAKVIVKSLLDDVQYLYINASDENGIDTIRVAVTNFAKTRSIGSTLKIVILDEVDGLTIDAQRALRNTMEEYSGNTRFILTANYKHRVIQPLQSRSQSFDLTPPIKGCVTRVVHILKQENINVSSDQKQLISHLIKTFYPDLRKTINELQKCCINGELKINTYEKHDEFIKQIFKTLEHDSLAVRKLIIQNEQLFNNDYPTLLKQMFEFMMDNTTGSVKTKKQLLIISEHLYRSALVLDQEINFYSCCISLENLDVN